MKFILNYYVFQYVHNFNQRIQSLFVCFFLISSIVPTNKSIIFNNIAFYQKDYLTYCKCKKYIGVSWASRHTSHVKLIDRLLRIIRHVPACVNVTSPPPDQKPTLMGFCVRINFLMLTEYNYLYWD